MYVWVHGGSGLQWHLRRPKTLVSQLVVIGYYPCEIYQVNTTPSSTPHRPAAMKNSTLEERSNRALPALRRPSLRRPSFHQNRTHWRTVVSIQRHGRRTALLSTLSVMTVGQQASIMTIHRPAATTVLRKIPLGVPCILPTSSLIYPFLLFLLVPFSRPFLWHPSFTQVSPHQTHMTVFQESQRAVDGTAQQSCHQQKKIGQGQ